MVQGWESGSVSFRSDPGRVRGLLRVGEDIGRRNQGRRSGFGHMKCRCSKAQACRSETDLWDPTGDRGQFMTYWVPTQGLSR